MDDDRRANPARPSRKGSWLGALLLPVMIAGPGSPAGAQDAVGTIPISATTGGPALAPSGRSGFFGVAFDSIFGSPDATPWRPMRLRSFFSEGWDEAWVPEPNDSGDAQQGWINAADGNFYRLHFLSYNFTNRAGSVPDGHTGAYTLYTPLSRRLELITNIPFVTSQPTFGVAKQTFPNPITPPRQSTSTGFGDITFTPRVIVMDTEDLTIVAQTSIQAPTGDRRVGAGQTILAPGAQVWWNFAESWVVRGGFSSGVGLNRQAGGTTLLSQLALGKVLTPHDVPLLGDFTLYLSANAFNTVSASKTTATLTPGFRTHLGGDYYALGGLEIPVTGGANFRENAIFWIMKTF